MRRPLPVLSLLLLWAGGARAHGLLIPEDKSVPPLAMLNHKVTVAIEDQAAVTRVEQTFRNHTDRTLEATYVFPVPKGASVNKFTMWVAGKEVKGELVEAKKARDIYTSIVRRTQDPGLLEHIGSNLLRLSVFPVAARSDQKVALSFTSVTPRESGLVEYVYPLKTSPSMSRSSRSTACRTSTRPHTRSRSSAPATSMSRLASTTSRRSSTATFSSTTSSGRATLA